MNIKEFENILKSDVQSFLNHWMEENKKNSNDYPLDLYSIADWFEQFVMWSENQ